MPLDPAIFKAYDIRGVVPAALNEAVARDLGRAFGAQALAAGEKCVAVGRDGRLSGPALAAALMEGLLDAGLDVIDIGLCTTPMLYYATHTLAQSGIQVTGSHNPKEYNGFKMVLAQQALYGAAIQALHQRMVQRDWPVAGHSARGTLRRSDILPGYRARIAADVRLARPMKIAVDCGNGAAGASAPGILRALGCEVIELFCEVDGHFPNHHPDPGRPENLRAVIAAVQAHDAELGLAFDGDGDRLGLITRDGENMVPDRQLMLLARDLLARQPGARIAYDVKCSQQLAHVIRAAGGEPLMCPTGHSLIKARMRETGALLGGEMSGHIFFRERWYGFDDGTYAAARLLEILSRSADPSALLHALPASCSTPELQIPCAEGQAQHIVARLQQQRTGAAFGAGAEICTIDGVRVDWPDGFGLIRASNTTPCLVLRFEGRTPQALARIRAAMLAQLEQVQPGMQARLY